MHITTKELRKIICDFDVNNIHLDFDPIIERFPKLESIILSTDYRMNYMHMYQLYPFFMSDHLFELDYPNFVRLCERAKMNNNNKRISLLNYLQYHSEILKRIKNIKVHSPNYIPLHFSIDYLQYYIINRNCDIHLLLHFKKVEFIEIEYELTIKEEELVEAIKHCQPNFIYNKVEKYCDILEH